MNPCPALWRRAVLCARALLLSVFAQAASAGDIVVAQVAPFSGGLAPYSKELSLGASVMFDTINARGGIGGSRIRFVTRDDRMDAPSTLALYADLARTEKPVAFLYPIGPVAIAALIGQSVPQKLEIPIIGTVPAMHKLRKPVNPYVFNIGMGDDAELVKIVEHIATRGIGSIGVVYWNEPSALEAVAFIEAQANSRKVQVTLKAPVTAGTDQVEPAVALVLTKAPGALIAILPVHATGAMVRQLRQVSNSTPVYGPSYTESSFLAKVAGGDLARGVAVSQVVPNPFSGQTPLAREYQDAMRRHSPPGTRFSTLSMEGYIAAKILVQAMLRAGPVVTGPSVKAALDKMQSVDLGGLVMSYDPQQHVALRFLDIGVVSVGGRLLY